MKFNPKLLNSPLDAADELIDGLVEAYNGECYKVGTRSIVKSQIAADKVGLLVGGGAGHEPIYHAMIGRNMADGAACGDIFAAPAPHIVSEAALAVDQGNGVLFLYGNYAGDIMNFNLGAEMAEDAGVATRTVLIADDVASAPPERKGDRRGIAGLVPIVKIAGAASQDAEDLDALAEVVERACLQTRSVGAAMAPGSIPATGTPTFELDEGMIGLGMGIHGEAGVEDIPMTTAADLTPRMLDLIVADFENDGDVEALAAGDSIVFLINSLGATTMMECLVCMRSAAVYFEERGVEIFDVMVGPFVTCQEMAGISFSVMRVDDELKRLWSMPCQSFCYSKMQGPLDAVGECGAGEVRAGAGAVVKKSGAREGRVMVDFSHSDAGLTVEEAREMLLLVADRVIEAEPILSQADRDLGDGDHGLGMKRGFSALRENLAGVEFVSLRELFQCAGSSLLTTMGGASGVVFGSLFLAGDKTMEGAEYFGSHELAHLLDQSLKDVMKRGGAKPGDKTMLDALAPAAVVAGELIDLPISESMVKVAEAADSGKEASKGMLATMGRAKTLGEKTIGLTDAGAISVSIILSTMEQFIGEL
ncbi:MAG: dihydroxyacetone kinase subunit DhaL [Akkermansiaceae bacterium]